MTDNTILLTACTLARANRLDAAEELILSDPRLNRLPAALDLLARIRARQGHIADARRLWNEILAIDPGNNAAQAALKALDTRFRIPKGTLFMVASIVIPVLFVITIGSCVAIKSKLEALRQAPPAAETTPEPAPGTPEPVLREFTSPSPGVDIAEIRPGAIRATIRHMPTGEDLKAVNDLKADLAPLRHVLVTSAFFSHKASSRKILSELLCEGLGIAPTQLYIAAGADTPGDSVQIDLIEETELPADTITPEPHSPAMIELQEFLVEPVDDVLPPAP